MKITGIVVASDGTVYSDKIESYNSKSNLYRVFSQLLTVASISTRIGYLEKIKAEKIGDGFYIRVCMVKSI